VMLKNLFCSCGIVLVPDKKESYKNRLHKYEFDMPSQQYFSL